MKYNSINVKELLKGEDLLYCELPNINNKLFYINLEQQEDGDILLRISLCEEYDYIIDNNGCADISFSIVNITEKGIENLLKNSLNICENEYEKNNDMNTIIYRCINLIEKQNKLITIDNV